MDFIVTVNGHYFQGSQAKLLYEFLETLDSSQVKVSVKPFKSNRSLDQNAYYWGVVLQTIFEFLKEAGGWEELTDPEDLHELLKLKFRPKTIKVKGTKIKIGASTKSLSSAEFSAYLEQVIAWATTTLDLTIPEPHEPY